MKFYDLTLPVSSKTPAWPGDISYSREERKTSAIVSELRFSSHFGTHIDAPKHFLFDKAGVDKFSLQALVGKFRVIELRSKSLISSKELLAKKIKAGEKLLFKTRNSNFVSGKKFRVDYTSLSLEAAKYLSTKKVALVGIDYFGIEAKSAPGHPVHKALLSKNIVIVEGLNLSAVKEGTYSGAILPLKIEGGDGSPARAVLWK